jgi:GT2 family glycosyltransferase
VSIAARLRRPRVDRPEDGPTLVSVVIPTRDRDDLLAEALASVRALEGPDLRLQILVADNGSSARTRGSLGT